MTYPTIKPLFLLLILVFFAFACGQTGNLPAPKQPIATLLLPSQNSPSPSNTLLPPTSTAASEPTDLIPEANIFLVQIDDGGNHGKLIGCNDSLIPVKIQPTPGLDPISDALGQLFSLKSQQIGSLYNF